MSHLRVRFDPLRPILAIFGGIIASDARAENDTPADAIRMLHQRAYCIVYQSSSASDILQVPPKNWQTLRLARSWHHRPGHRYGDGEAR
jgi:hypothetical protein